jgi:hypothetical protein
LIIFLGRLNLIEVYQEAISNLLLRNRTPSSLMFIYIALIFGIGSQHDGEPSCFFITFQRDFDKAGHGHREDHTNRSQNPSPEDQ